MREGHVLKHHWQHLGSSQSCEQKYNHCFVAKMLILLLKSLALCSGAGLVSRNFFQQVKHCQPEEASVAEQFHYLAWGNARVSSPLFTFHSGEQSH